MSLGLCVLIVDRCEESREVLRTALGRRGVQTFETAKADEGLSLAHSKHPDLIVLDLEAIGADGSAGDFTAAAENEGSSLLMIGNLRSKSGATRSEFIAKPYHYKPLILKIEELLRQRHRRQAA